MQKFIIDDFAFHDVLLLITQKIKQIYVLIFYLFYLLYILATISCVTY